MMKTKSLLFLFVLVSFVSFAQTNMNTEEIAIKKSLTNFTNSIKTKNIDQAISYIYPKLFIVIPKEQMYQLLNMTYNNPLIKLEVKNLRFGNIEKPEFINKEYFSIANYFFQLKLDVSSINEDVKKNIETGLMNKYGKNNVKYLANEGSYLINANMRACAVSQDKKIWRFIILEKEYKPQLVKVLPKKILDKI